jgi:hypothetical protein
VTPDSKVRSQRLQWRLLGLTSGVRYIG